MGSLNSTACCCCFVSKVRRSVDVVVVEVSPKLFVCSNTRTTNTRCWRRQAGRDFSRKVCAACIIPANRKGLCLHALCARTCGARTSECARSQQRGRGPPLNSLPKATLTFKLLILLPQPLTLLPLAVDSKSGTQQQQQQWQGKTAITEQNL